jgi:poly [ADP-ribose] polymerase
VKSLMELIFDEKRMTEAVVEMSYDVKKLPLGKLTNDQIKC